MDWNLIRVFLSVADNGTLSRASEALEISQPTVGRHINELEAITGLTLFVRGRSGMELSEAGLKLVDDARGMASEAEQFILKAAGTASTVSGTIRITASEVVSTHLLPPLLCALKDAEPEIDIELVASNNVDNLLARDADIAIRMFRPTQNDLIARKVNEMAMGIHIAESYQQQFGAPTSFTELFRHRIVGYDRNDLIITSMAAYGVKANRDMFTFRTDDQVVYWELVKAGAGIGFYPRYIAANTPGIITILPGLEIGTMPMWLTAHQELRTNLRIRRVMDFLSDALSDLNL
ncbi:MAG: LysR family transcriptional regulator [Thiolinea sp.]